jgi:hypothetical protein
VSKMHCLICRLKIELNGFFAAPLKIKCCSVRLCVDPIQQCTRVNWQHSRNNHISLVMNDLILGIDRAFYAVMKDMNLIVLLWMLLLPAALSAGDKMPDVNVNERYDVESIAYSGIDESRISRSLRDEAQGLVGEKYSQKSADDIAQKLRDELKEYDVEVKVKRGDKPEHVKVIFQTKRIRWKRFQVPIPSVVYHSKQGFNGTLEIPITIHHSVFTFGILSDADQLLERNAGIRLRYENRKLGTDLVHLRIDFDSYHQSFNAATEGALPENPEVPGIYRTRQNFAPSLSLFPTRDLMLSAGTSFQRLQMQYPMIRTETAYAGTADIRYRRKLESQTGYRQDLSAGYSMRTATRILESDFIYTRHYFTADYTLSKGRNLFGAHFIGGYITGTAPLFERFSFGNSSTLRGWNKFDVAPLGGNRAAHGSLEYRYRPFHIFYDVGTVWDRGQSAQVRHGLGFGLATKGGFFASLAFPVRLHDVAPIFMTGFRF